ncbi:MAG: 3-hydroxyanthranilate 3,4-dioxygenase [Candidatus Binatia bacterium]
MKELTPIDLKEIIEATKAEGKGRRILWQDSESIAFLSRGRKQRLDFHIDPSDEVTLQLSGEQRLHYITPEGEQRVAVINAGQIVLCPGGVPHSPRVLEDSWFIVFERKRRDGEQDRFLWFCDHCGEKVHEIVVTVGDYSQDPVSQVHKQFYADESMRTCRRCGAVIPTPNP